MQVQNQTQRRSMEIRPCQFQFFQKISMESQWMEDSILLPWGQSLTHFFAGVGTEVWNVYLPNSYVLSSLNIHRASADSLPSYFFASNNPYAVSVEEEVTVEEEDSISHEGNDVPTDQWREAFVEKFSNMREVRILFICSSSRLSQREMANADWIKLAKDSFVDWPREEPIADISFFFLSPSAFPIQFQLFPRPCSVFRLFKTHLHRLSIQILQPQKLTFHQ